ncbi:unnamed protein product [Vicia faba]|uniref:Knl1 C-terminal RWD domain-containing protein n=1 Tax=Vicia faba TaxID=3906 RepID=A0AAV0ZJD8_VICFA|nr:unnamed protein product [Vicia faba]
MASTEPSNNTETEEETTAFHRKRARRVSFADNEITSVHIFRPDDDHSTSSSDIPPVNLGLFRELGGVDSDDEDAEGNRNPTDDAAEAVDHRNSFLQPIGSPSPGGSSTNLDDDDTDDDEFRGPVSTDFIKPGRLSDSGVSDDITMDSTAFSMHYRSLARSDSGDLKTPTRFDATMSTPVQNSHTSGSYMEITDGKKKAPQSPVLRSGSGDSDYMSIVGKSETYDYARLSPGLVAILDYGNKDLDVGSKATHSPIANDTGVLPNLECSVNSPAHQITHDTAVASTSESSTKNTKEFVNDATPLTCKQLDSAKANRGTPPKMDEGDKFDLAAKYEQVFSEVQVNDSNSKDRGQGTDTNHKSDQVTGSHPEFAPLSHSANKLVFMGSPDRTGNITPPLEESGLPVPEVRVANSATLSSRLKSISNLNPEITPNTSTLKEGSDKLKHGFSKDRGQGSDANHKSDHVIGSHTVHEFTPLSHSANKPVYMGSPDSFRCTGNITPPLEKCGLPLLDVHVANSVTLSSIRKSISKLKTPKTTPNTSTLKEGIDKLKHRFSNYSPGTSFFTERDFENKQVGTLTAPLEEQPFSFTLENNMHKSLITTDDHVVDSLIHISKLSQNTETVATKTDEETVTTKMNDDTVATKKDGEKNCLVSTNVSDNDKNLNPVDTGASPLLKTHITRVADFDMADSTAGKRKDEILTATHAKPFSSPVKSFDHALSPFVECQSNRHAELKQMEMQNECVNSGLGQTIEYDRRAVAKKLDLSGVGNSEQPSSPFEDAQGALKGKPGRSPKRFLNLSSPIKAATTVLPSLQETPSDIRDLSHRIDSDGHGVDLDNNHHPTLQAPQSLHTKTGIEVSSGEKREASEILSNGDNRQKGKVTSFNAIREATTVLPSPQKPPSDIRDLSQRYNSDGHGVGFNNNHHPAFQVSQSPLTKTGIEVSSGKKRKGVILSDGDNIDKIGRIDRSPEVHMRGNGDLPFVLEQTSYMRSEREKFGDQKWNDWDQILQRFSTSTKQLRSPSFVKLNLRSIGMLEDVLVNLQKVKKWDILSSEIHSQKFADPQNTRHKRVVEVKMLLFNIAYEKAKLQLMNVKRDRLLKKAQQLSSGLQETQMIKNSMLCSAKSGPVDIQADDSHINARLFNSQGKCQVSYEKRMEMRQELESLDQKAKSLSEFFYSHCKMEGDQSCTNILKSVPDYLEKRMSYKLVFRKLKLWDIEDFERKDDYHLITLNYRGYIIQRFTVNAGLSSIIVSNSLNDVNIGKTYPNMDAFSAFLFALNPLTTSKCTGQISMAQETQITGSLLSNLLDVVEEVQLARIEIGNLVQAKFNSQSVHQLDLQLSFIDFLGGKKVQVILDMACLKCGAYPAEVLPSQIYDSAASREQNLPSLLVDEIRTAAESVDVGYSRIIRLCRCISQVVRGCTRGI